MEIKKNGFIANVAYWDEPPHQTTLCVLWWRFVLRLLPLLYLLIFFLIASFFALLFGARFAIFSGDGDDDVFVPVKRWPRFLGARITPVNLLALPFTLLVSRRPAWLEQDRNGPMVEVKTWPTLFGSRVWPIIVPLVYVVWWIVRFLVSKWATLSISATQYQYAGYIVSALALVLLMTWAVISLSRTSAWHMTWEYLKAKKEKVCPIVYIR